MSFQRIVSACVLVPIMLSACMIAGDSCGIQYDNFSFAKGHKLEMPYRDTPRSIWGPDPLTIFYGREMQTCRSDASWAEKRAVSSAEYWVRQKVNYCHHHLPTWTPGYQRGFGYPKPNDEERPSVCSYDPAPKGQMIRWNYSGSGDETAEAWMHPGNGPARGRFGNGADCSDFTALVYNWGFGIRFTSAVSEQAGQASRDAQQHELAPNMADFREWLDDRRPEIGPAGKLVCSDGAVDDGNRCAAHGGYMSVYDADGNFNPNAITDEMLAKLHPGDLLFIAGSAKTTKHVTHVVMWTGQKIGGGSIAKSRIAPQRLVGYSYGQCSADVWKAENNPGVYIIVDSHYQGPDYRAFTPCFYRSQVWGVRRVLSAR
jgi:hypothetical protein